MMVDIYYIIDLLKDLSNKDKHIVLESKQLYLFNERGYISLPIGKDWVYSVSNGSIIGTNTIDNSHFIFDPNAFKPFLVSTTLTNSCFFLYGKDNNIQF